MRPCCTDRNLSVTLTEINPADTAENVETWLRGLNLDEPFEHFKSIKDKRDDACRFFRRYGDKKLEEGRDPTSSNEVVSLQADIEDLKSKIYEHKAAINLLRAEIHTKKKTIVAANLN
ncbi:uncharacterized protein EV154DRAFT_535939 [Mucor mucedo]|uniref:uncharacterized protein n=1 Tax=Mucor mucedo TaxID=29922 RepID=UPI00221F0093|nr:uncharacterized protein EV154DRAFT_535939 [Mucor mucedo]KAI7895894.1 hypothetical protein EV154DRAFT_535939 [Mucor mucedo]